MKTKHRVVYVFPAPQEAYDVFSTMHDALVTYSNLESLREDLRNWGYGLDGDCECHTTTTIFNICRTVDGVFPNTPLRCLYISDISMLTNVSVEVEFKVIPESEAYE